MVQDTRDAVYDRKPRPSPDAVRIPSSSMANSLNTVRNFDDGMPMPESVTWITTLVAATRAPTTIRPEGVFDRVRDKVLDQAAQQGRVRADGEPGGHHHQFQIFLAGHRRKIRLDLLQQPARGTVEKRGFIAPVSSR